MAQGPSEDAPDHADVRLPLPFLRDQPIITQGRHDTLRLERDVSGVPHRWWLSPSTDVATVEQFQGGEWKLFVKYGAEGREKCKCGDGSCVLCDDAGMSPREENPTGAKRYSGIVTLTVTIVPARTMPHGEQYRVRFSKPDGKPAIQHVGMPKTLTGAIDGPVAYDDAARAAISFLLDEDEQEHDFESGDFEQSDRGFVVHRKKPESIEREGNPTSRGHDDFFASIDLGNDEMMTESDAGKALERLAARVADGETNGKIHDVNGNRVGYFLFGKQAPVGVRGQCNVHLSLGNEAMRTKKHVASALREVGGRLEEGTREGIVKDVNGNKVGAFEFQLPKGEQKRHGNPAPGPEGPSAPKPWLVTDADGQFFGRRATEAEALHIAKAATADPMGKPPYKVEYRGGRHGNPITSALPPRNDGSWIANYRDEILRRFQETAPHGRLHINSASGALYIRFVNLPDDVSGANGGGAETQNNMMTFEIQNFDWRNEPIDGKLSIKQRTSSLPREYTLRGKKAHPDQIATYLIEFLQRVTREVRPNLTHTRVGNPTQGGDRGPSHYGFCKVCGRDLYRYRLDQPFHHVGGESDRDHEPVNYEPREENPVKRGDRPAYEPSKKILNLLRVERSWSPYGDDWKVLFNDGMQVQVHPGSGKGGRLYAMRPYDTRHDDRRDSPETRRARQYAALRSVLGDSVAAQFYEDSEGDIVADLDDWSQTPTPSREGNPVGGKMTIAQARAENPLQGGCSQESAVDTGRAMASEGRSRGSVPVGQKLLVSIYRADGNVLLSSTEIDFSKDMGLLTEQEERDFLMEIAKNTPSGKIVEVDDARGFRKRIRVSRHGNRIDYDVVTGALGDTTKPLGSHASHGSKPREKNPLEHVYQVTFEATREPRPNLKTQAQYDVAASSKEDAVAIARKSASLDGWNVGKLMSVVKRHAVREKNPLAAGHSPKTVSANIRKMKAEGKPQKQAVAIALSVADKSAQARHMVKIGAALRNALIPWETDKAGVIRSVVTASMKGGYASRKHVVAALADLSAVKTRYGSSMDEKQKKALHYVISGLKTALKDTP